MTASPAAYDSRADTQEHIRQVQSLIGAVVVLLGERASKHDLSKFEEPEKSMFDKYTPMLADSEIEDEQYQRIREEMGPGLAHHYAHNSHHPEHWANGIYGMSLLDLTEMFCDWVAAGKRHASGGDIVSSIEKLQDRFRFDDGLKQILLNTARELGLVPVPAGGTD